MTAMQRATLAEQAYRKLRDRIVAGELVSGQRLLPEELGQTLAISPTPVKEALTMLQRDGLIEVESRRGSAVRRFTRADIVDLYDARQAVECHAVVAGLAAGRVDGAFLQRIERCAAQHADRSRRRRRADLLLALRHDHDLHTLLMGLAGNRLLSDWHQGLLRQTQLARVYSLRAYDAGRLARAQREHAAILAGLRDGDRAAALAALIAHLDTSRANVLEEYA